MTLWREERARGRSYWCLKQVGIFKDCLVMPLQCSYRRVLFERLCGEIETLRRSRDAAGK